VKKALPRCRGRGRDGSGRTGRGGDVTRESFVHGDHRRIAAALARLEPRQVRLECVARVEEQAHGRLVGDAPAFAKSIEQRLHLVRRVGELREAEGAAASLDRMRGAEDRVEQFRIAPSRAERHRTLLDRLQVLLGLVEECRMKRLRSIATAFTADL
jgi:hypothetical protein